MDALGLPMPSTLVRAAQAEGRTAWLEKVPAIVTELARRWRIDVEAPFQPGGHTAWVAPAHTSEGDDLVVKVAWRHMEADHERDGLLFWAGGGAVRLVASAEFEDAVALLLERCRPGTPLSSIAEVDQDEVVAGLLRRLWREPPPGHPFRPLCDMCDAWADEFEHNVATGDVAIDRGLAAAGVELFRTLPATADRSVLLCTDLHAGNVLAATREPWLAIDPKPFAGDRTYDALQHMLNCDGRLRADPRALVGRMAGLLDLDAERLARWLFARCVVETAHWPGLLEVARAIRVV